MVPEAEIFWSRLSGWIADTLGLHFPRARWPDLQRSLKAAAVEFGFHDVAACADWWLSTPLTAAQLQTLAGHLTIGETYFFREQKTFEVLATRVLPELIQARRGREQRLRLWSAGCCTGEEPYSLAILLHRVLPDLADWQVTIVGTDINRRFLQKSAAAVYAEWSFRETPDGFKQRYFERTQDGHYTLLPEIRKLVTFAPLNLADDVYPALATNTNAMDLILCRNVLMYFSPAQTRKVIAKLHHSVVDGGWLAVSPSEASQTLFSQFVTRNYPGTILFQKTAAKIRAAHRGPPQAAGAADWPVPMVEQGWPGPPSLPAAMPGGSRAASTPRAPDPAETPPPSRAGAAMLLEPGHDAEAAEAALVEFAGHPLEPQAMSRLARALANQGKLTAALAWCDRWVAAAKLDPFAHYLRAMVLQELGVPAQARQALQRALYLEPGFTLAHFAAGNLARAGGRSDEARKHFDNALRLLRNSPPNEPLPESDGLTVGRLAEMITSIAAIEPVS